MKDTQWQTRSDSAEWTVNADYLNYLSFTEQPTYHYNLSSWMSEISPNIFQSILSLTRNLFHLKQCKVLAENVFMCLSNISSLFQSELLEQSTRWWVKLYVTSSLDTCSAPSAVEDRPASMIIQVTGGMTSKLSRASTPPGMHACWRNSDI